MRRDRRGVGARRAARRLVLAAAAALSLASASAAAEKSPLESALEARLEVVRATKTLLEGKLALRESERRRRIRASNRELRAARGVLSSARRRLALRLLLRRDSDEVALLKAELESARAADELIRGSLGRSEPLPPSHSLRSPLARGILKARAGEYRDSESGALLVRRGVELEGRPGDRVVAADAGRVVFTGPLRNLGETVIVSHGALLTVMAGVERPLVAVGDSLPRGASVAELGGATLYFEVRLKLGALTLPVDPMPLLER